MFDTPITREIQITHEDLVSFAQQRLSLLQPLTLTTLKYNLQDFNETLINHYDHYS